MSGENASKTSIELLLHARSENEQNGPCQRGLVIDITNLDKQTPQNARLVVVQNPELFNSVLKDQSLLAMLGEAIGYLPAFGELHHSNGTSVFADYGVEIIDISSIVDKTVRDKWTAEASGVGYTLH